MKIQRLDYNRFAEVLSERGLVDPQTLQLVLQQSFSTGEPFPEILIRENLVTDWELSRTACEAFQLVFLSVDVYPPSKEAVELVDPQFMHQQCIVPLDCYGNLLTIALPGLTPSEVIASLGEKLGKTIQPVVGTAASNRRWLNENVKLPKSLDSVASPLPASLEEDWSQVFDQGDAAVLMDLQAHDEKPEEEDFSELGNLAGLEGLEGLGE